MQLTALRKKAEGSAPPERKPGRRLTVRRGAALLLVLALAAGAALGGKALFFSGEDQARALLSSAGRGRGVAVLEGVYAGAGFGLAVGLLWELAYPGGFGGLVFGMALAGMITGAVSQYALSQSFLSCLLCSAGVLGVLDGLRILRILFLQAETLDVLLQIAVPEVVLSLCWTPVVYWIFRRIYRRVGGTKLA